MILETIEQTLNGLLEADADRLGRAVRYERTENRLDTRAGFYEKKLHTKAGEVTLKAPKFRKTAEYYPETLWQYFYRNIFRMVPKGKIVEVANMLEAIHACKNKALALQRATAISNKLEQISLPKAANKVRMMMV